MKQVVLVEIEKTLCCSLFTEIIKYKTLNSVEYFEVITLFHLEMALQQPYTFLTNKVLFYFVWFSVIKKSVNAI